MGNRQKKGAKGGAERLPDSLIPFDVMKNLELLFEKIDTNKDGIILESEVVNCFEHWSDYQKMFKLFKAIDSNKDGKVSREAYVNYWKLLVKNKQTTIEEVKLLLSQVLQELNDRDDLLFELTTIDEAINQSPAIVVYVKDKLDKGQYDQTISKDLEVVLTYFTTRDTARVSSSRFIGTWQTFSGNNNESTKTICILLKNLVEVAFGTVTNPRMSAIKAFERQRKRQKEERRQRINEEIAARIESQRISLEKEFAEQDSDVHAADLKI